MSRLRQAFDSCHRYVYRTLKMTSIRKRDTIVWTIIFLIFITVLTIPKMTFYFSNELEDLAVRRVEVANVENDKLIQRQHLRMVEFEAENANTQNFKLIEVDSRTSDENSLPQRRVLVEKIYDAETIESVSIKACNPIGFLSAVSVEERKTHVSLSEPRG